MLREKEAYMTTEADDERQLKTVLTPRVSKALQSAGVVIVSDLDGWTARRLLGLKGIGPCAADNILRLAFDNGFDVVKVFRSTGGDWIIERCRR